MQKPARAFQPVLVLGILLPTLLIGVTGAMCTEPFHPSYADYDALLKRVVSDGRVEYKSLVTDSGALDRYLESAADVKKSQFERWTESERLAFLINLYNATTLKLIVDHYPVKSIKKIGSIFREPWDQPIVRLFGHVLTLNNLEHDIIRKKYDEPRIHMALVCAAKGCPPLRSEEYVAERLDSQLDDQSKTYLSSPEGIRIDRKNNKVYLSSIFKWYGNDFPSVIAFAEKYSGENLEGLSVRWLDYDWGLNEK